MTGWERYTRALAQHLTDTDPFVQVRVAGSDSLPSRLWQDAVAMPLATRSARVVHFPTLPPVPWAKPKGATVYTLHDLTWWKWRETASQMGRHYYAPLASRLLRRDVHLVTVSHAVADEAAQFFRIDRGAITVAPLGVELPRPRRRTARARPYLLSVGTLEPRKNLARLAEAFALSGVAATHDLIVVGRPGWGAAPPGVQVVSGLGDDGLAEMYAGATALVLPSLYEGFGLPAVEAMQMGVPVLCSDIPTLREVTGGFATYVDATDVDSLADALRDVRHAAAPSAAAAWARQSYRWDTTARTLSTLYRRVDAELLGAGR